MHRPVVGEFQGSLPGERVAEVGFARQLDMALSFIAMLAAAMVWIAAYCLADQADLPTVLKAASLVLLLSSLSGLWLMRRAEQAPRVVLADIYDSVFCRLAQGDRLAVDHVAEQEGYRGLAGLVGDLAMAARKLHTRRVRREAVIAEANLALASSRMQVGQVADQIRTDAACLADMAAQVDRDDARLSDEIAATSDAVELTDTAICHALDGIGNLAGAVRATTVGAERMTTLAASLSQVAHTTQRTVAELDGRAAKMAIALDSLATTLNTTLSRLQGDNTGESDSQSGAGEPSGTMLRDMADSMLGMLRDGMQTLHELTVATNDALQRTGEISDLVYANQEAGQAICRAVQQQGEDISRILMQLYEARSGFTTLRGGVDAVERAEMGRHGTAETLRQTAQRLPTRAETVAGILRGIPDFAPPPGF